MSCRFLLNRVNLEADLPPDTLVLAWLRDAMGLTGTKEACGEGDCGACQVLLGDLRDGRVHYRAVNACLLPAAQLNGRHLVTIEGLNSEQLNPVQRALVDHGAIQCGFCTPGLVMALTGFFLNASCSDEAEALDAVAGNLCRCTGYAGIKRAITALCRQFDLAAAPLECRIEDLIAWRILPEYFATAADKLSPYPAEKTPAPPEHAVLIAGGTDLFVQKPEKLRTQPLHFLTREPVQAPVREEQACCVIYALATLEQVRTSPLLQAYFPRLAEDFKLICSAPVRQRATIGGNLVNASPIADLAVFLLALDVELTIASGAQTRSVPLRHFFQAYKQIDLKPGERLLDIRFQTPASGAQFSYEKVGKREHLDIAAVNSALLIQVEHDKITKAQLSAGGVAPYPLYLAKTSAYLTGQALCLATVKTAAGIALTEIAPISDSRGSAEYKRLLLQQLLCAHFVKLFSDTFAGESFHAD